MKTLIAPSILSADFGKLNEDIASVDGLVDLLHVDVMDGHFVPNITLGAPVVRCIRSKVPLDCHLMIQNPGKYVEDFVKASAGSITIHAETVENEADLKTLLKTIRGFGVKAAVSVNPETSLDPIRGVLDEMDMVLLMTVHPGFGGQKFIEEVLPKIRELRGLKPELDIQVDGGINVETAKKCREAGANIFVAGSYIFGASDRVGAIRALREAIQ